jgi:hypothetical protein
MLTHVPLVVNRETTFGALNMRRVSSETRVRRVRASQTLEPDSNRMNRLFCFALQAFYYFGPTIPSVQAINGPPQWLRFRPLFPFVIFDRNAHWDLRSQKGIFEFRNSFLTPARWMYDELTTLESETRSPMQCRLPVLRLLCILY